MARIIVMGGCGSVGSAAIRTLLSGDYFDAIVIAENRYEAACSLAESLDPQIVSAIRIDANDPEDIKEAVKGSDVVLNCVGPFYKYGPVILRAVIESGVNYVDVCDDLDATEMMLELDEYAQEKGVSALIGMGSSPGIANVLVRFCAESLLDEVDAVDIYHVHGGEEVEGPAVIKHRIHSMSSDIPVFIDGKQRMIKMFDESGKEFYGETDFRDIGTYPVFPYPHPETVTLPKYLKGVKRVTNLGLVLPLEYYEMIMDIVRLGLTEESPIEVEGSKVSPQEFSVAFILKKREELIKKCGIECAMGCAKISVEGRKEGEYNKYIFSMVSKEKGMGEGTGIPAALGSILMSQGKIEKKGAFPPEAAVKPAELIALTHEAVKSTGMGEEAPIFIERIDRNGNKTEVPFNF